MTADDGQTTIKLNSRDSETNWGDVDGCASNIKAIQSTQPPSHKMIHPQQSPCVLPGATQMREPWLTLVYPLGARAGTNQRDIGSNNAAVTFDRLASTPPFDGATGPDGGDRTLPASSSSSIDSPGRAQQEQRNLLVPSGI
ncbi:hypothetical protein PC9H_003293 [Pleurotus ostreatus]|uniref:Uncharacterized protein n=2 Tax=Pleurotus TaxID=5320 RepID=A0A8H7DV78_PLEOS|nr:uncharacterized protein PC9H_003293 [Pleurotus ostreatus]KAF7436460.1 hypothetical protein PC9H_003293 [Pleurotus ostreatus]KAG9222465.1 hypothetical protein CCMSSC00406_0002800 [Pleurotus cornucopiae]